MCISTGLIGLSVFTSILSNPRLLPEKLPETTFKFSFRVLTGTLMVISGIISLVGESWFTWSAYTNNLGDTVAPGQTAEGYAGAAYAPDWACVLNFCISSVTLIAGIIHLCRACCIQSVEQKGLTNDEIFYTNRALHVIQPDKPNERQLEAIGKRPPYYYKEDPREVAFENRTYI